ncbi:DUF4403 family protein [Salegentibacter sp. HM20]
MKNSLLDEVSLRLPVKISYKVIEDFLKKKMIGEKISQEKNGKSTDYAEIQDIEISSSPEEGYDLAINLKLQILTTLFKNRKLNLLLHAKLDFDETGQLISVKKYNLDGKSRNWLLDNLLEGLSNTLLYNSIIRKMRVDLSPHIKEQLASVNSKLEDDMETAPGVHVSGYIKDFRIVDIIPGSNQFLIGIEITGHGLIDIRKIGF